MKKIKKNILNALEYLEQNPTSSITFVANLFQVDRHTLSNYRTKRIDRTLLFENKQNKSDDYLYLFSNEELEIIEYYINNSEKPYKNIKEKFLNAPDIRALRNWSNILGYSYHTGAIQKYHYNKNKFNEITTEEDAYWLGFITADGCVIENKFLQIKLAEKDKNHLIKFCNYLELPESEINEIIKNGFGGSYTKNNPVSIIRICCKEIINNLINKGILPRKSGKENPYICNSFELQKAYIRGIIDGDGYLRSTQYGIGVVGSKEICDYIFNFINENIIDISNNHIHKHGSIWKLELGGRLQTSKIIQCLYCNSKIHLDRKYELYINKYNN